MQSELAVDITLGDSHMSGVGMFANNATGELKLLSHTKIHYPPPTAR